MENFLDLSNHEELFSLLPEQNFDDSITSHLNHNEIDNLLIQQQTNKSFTLNSENCRSLIEISTNTNDTQSMRQTQSKSIEESSQSIKDKPYSSDEKNSTKIKFKNVLQFKKDVVIKKLLKTIDVMNQELNKRDQLIMTMEKENTLLNNSKEFKTFTNANEQAYFLVEISRLKQDNLNERNENELLRQKVKFLEKQIADFKRDEQATFMTEYKDLISPANNRFSSKNIDSNNLDNIVKLKNENEELNQLNNILKIELDKLSKQIDLIEKRNTLEKEINEKFEDIIKQKECLEDENKSLLNKIDVLREEMKICLINFEQELTQMRNAHSSELFELKTKLEQEEIKSEEIIKGLESQLSDSNLVIEKLDEERTFLVGKLKSTKEEKEVLQEELEKRTVKYEKKIETIGTENEKYKKNCESLYQVNFEQQKQIQKLFHDLESKNESNEKMSLKKCDELKRLRQALTLSNEKLKFQQVKYETEIEDLKKKQGKEVEILKFNNEQMTIRNGELSRSNGELRKKIQTIENELKELNEKFQQTKHTNEILIKQKKELKEENERILFDKKKEIDVLEKLRDEYLRKNNSQQSSIDQMLEKVSNFQNEIDALIKRNEELDEKLKRKNSMCDAYRKKNAEIKSYLKKALFQSENIPRPSVQKQQHTDAMQLSQNIIFGFVNSFIKDLRLDSLEENNDAT